LDELGVGLEDAAVNEHPRGSVILLPETPEGS